MPPELALATADNAELQRLIALYRDLPRQMQQAVMAFLEAGKHRKRQVIMGLTEI